jgi:hypothetical protein
MENVTTKHPDVSRDENGNNSLLKRGSYVMPRLLVTINAAGPEGIPTRRLLDQIGTHAIYTKKVIDRAEREGYISHMEGEPLGPGKFPLVYYML